MLSLVSDCSNDFANIFYICFIIHADHDISILKSMDSGQSGLSMETVQSLVGVEHWSGPVIAQTLHPLTVGEAAVAARLAIVIVVPMPAQQVMCLGKTKIL